jgi:hypothetical protein
LDRYPEATVYGYDLSVDHWGPQIYDNVKYDGRAFFNKFGISAQDEPDQTPPNYSLKTMMAMNGHDVSSLSLPPLCSLNVLYTMLMMDSPAKQYIDIFKIECAAISPTKKQALTHHDAIVSKVPNGP